MQKILGRVIMALCCCMFFAATVQAKSLNKVYLTGGGIIECRTYWKADGKVMVSVNRDVLLALSPDEVDMKRTFAHKPVTLKKKVKAVKKKVSTTAKEPAAAPKPVAEAGKPPVSGGKPGVAPASKPVAQPPGPATQVPAQKAVPPPVAQPLPAKAPKAAPQLPGPATTAPALKPGTPPSTQPIPAPVPTAKPASPGQQPPAATAPVKPAPVPGRAPIPIVTAEPSGPAPPALREMPGMGTLVPFFMVIVFLIASVWKVFAKAGEAGWQCLIPLWNMYVIVKISGKPWWWFLLMFVPVVSIIILILVNIAIAERFNKGALFGLGLTFFGFIFFPVLAFSKAEYR